ncbi:MAG TPA: ribonuclease R [Clostridiales bacterium]|nr:ribonuclease R [Clostridiales bacterium]
MAQKYHFVILKKFRRGDYDGKSFKFIHRAEKEDLRLSERTLDTVLSDLINDGKIVCKDGKFYLTDKERLKLSAREEEKVVGKLRCNERGFGFVVVEGDKDYYVSPDLMGQALDTDIVECRVLPGKNGANDAAEIIKVVERGFTSIVGTFFNEGGNSYVRPDDRAYLADIYIPNGLHSGAEVGDKVFVAIEKFPKNRCPEGKINAIIGKANDFSTEEECMLYSSGVFRTFDEKVMAEAKSIEQKVGDNRLIGRLDLRNKLIFTIDGDNSKDYDDAVSLEESKNGNYLLGVHIADVTAYVKFKGEIDKEAFERGTSVYLPDRVIPMLPFELSNGICSLNEGVDRLTVSVFTEIDKLGNVLSSQIFESVINSKHRMTYNNVDGIIDGNEVLRTKYADIAPVVDKMNELRLILEKRRKEAGYVELDVREGDITLDGGKINISLHKATPATKLIEQFMILANEQVAEYLFYGNYPCVFRVHEKPSPEKLENLKKFLNALGIRVPWRKDEIFSSDFARLLLSVAEKPTFAVVNRTVLRSMQKAYYSTENEGHFGLASKCYCHFTSPIRRYPDLTVHRILKAALNGDISAINDLYEDFSTLAANNSSDREKRAEECERNVDDLYKAKFMEDKIGEKFDGIISGVIANGLFVELQNTCEGFVPLDLLPVGKYTFDADTYRLYSSKRSFKLGDKVKIIVVSADFASRRVDFALVDEKSCVKKKKVVK